MSETQQKDNKLYYKRPEDNLIVSDRKLVQNKFQKDLYQSDRDSEMICTLNESEHYLLSQNCYLAVNVNVFSTPDSPDLEDEFQFNDDAGMLALFKDLLIESDGVELERIQDVYIYARNNLYASCGQDYIRTIGSVGGIIYPPNTDNTAQGIDLWGVNQQFIIPLWFLSGLFKGNKHQLMPSKLKSHLKIRLSLNPPEKCFVRTVDTDPDTNVYYQLTNCYIATDEIRLTAPVYQKLNQMNLEYMYNTIFTTKKSFNASQLSLNIDKSVSRACSIMSIIQREDTLQDYIPTSGASNLRINELNHNIGQQRFPQQDIKTSAELYFNMLVSNNFLENCDHMPAVDDNLYNGANNNNLWFGAIKQTFDRMNDDGLYFRGLPINSSRRCIVNYKFDSVQQYLIYAFLEYAKLAIIDKNSNIIEIKD